MSQEFAERIGGFLQDKMAQIQLSHGQQSSEYQALARQYFYTPTEDEPSLEDNLKHYNAAVGEDIGLKRAERLYQRQLSRYCWSGQAMVSAIRCTGITNPARCAHSSAGMS